MIGASCNKEMEPTYMNFSTCLALLETTLWPTRVASIALLETILWPRRLAKKESKQVKDHLACLGFQETNLLVLHYFFLYNSK